MDVMVGSCKGQRGSSQAGLLQLGGSCGVQQAAVRRRDKKTLSGEVVLSH
jgi:hypothetical protein